MPAHFVLDHQGQELRVGELALNGFPVSLARDSRKPDRRILSNAASSGIGFGGFIAIVKFRVSVLTVLCQERPPIESKRLIKERYSGLAPDRTFFEAHTARKLIGLKRVAGRAD